MDDLLPEVPVEVWRLIFSWLPFNDQLNCRTICKDWLELITTLPEFKTRNCLNLDYCTLSENEPPVTTLSNSKLQFGAMRVESKMHLELFPSLTAFLSQIGEHVTYLDISKALYSDSFRVIVENLHLFKVLHHFIVGSLTDWLREATSSSPGQDVMRMILFMMLRGDNPREITYESAKKFLEDETVGDFRQSIVLKRHKDLFLARILEHLDELNDEFRENVAGQETIDIIVRKVQREIDEIDKGIDLSTRINKSVRIISLRDEVTLSSFEQMLELTPNVREINIQSSYLSDGILQVLEKYPEKIASIQLREEDLPKIEKFNLCNLKGIKIGNEYTRYRKEMLDRCIDLFPSLKTVSACTSLLPPQTHFEYLTELGIQRKSNDQIQLCELTAFKHLHTLTVSLWNHLVNTDEAEICFFGHQTVSLDSIKKLKFNTCLGPCCINCIDTMLQSLPNLRDLDFMDDHDGQYVDKIFRYQTKLEKFKILSRERMSVFTPKSDWPEMKRLRTLVLSYDSIGGDKACWDSFGRKLDKLKYLQVHAHQCVNLLDMIGVNMPLLQKVGILVRPRTFYPRSQPIRTRTIVRGGRKFVIDEYGP